MATITIPQMASELNGAATALRGPPSALLKICKVAIIADGKLNFANSADPDGKPWKRLAIPRASGGNLPLRDKGLLMASLAAGKGHVERTTATTIEIGSNLPQARLLHDGDVVKPKKGKYLAIPRTREAARVLGPRQFPRPLFAIFGKKGGVLIDRQRQGRGKRTKMVDVVQYWLVKSVTIPARRFTGAGPRLIAKLTRLVGDFWGKLLTRGKP